MKYKVWDDGPEGAPPVDVEADNVTIAVARWVLQQEDTNHGGEEFRVAVQHGVHILYFEAKTRVDVDVHRLPFQGVVAGVGPTG